MTTKAMMTNNEFKKKRSRSMAGREKPDETIKKIKFEPGNDDAVSTLHKQRFKFRTPLAKPKDYWYLMPLGLRSIYIALFRKYLDNDI